METIRYILGGILLLLGLAIFFIEVFGVNRFRNALNRMHAAALGDTMGLTFSLMGLMIVSGINFNTLKMFMVIIFLWVSSPVASHMLTKLEAETNPNLKDFCGSCESVKELEESLESMSDDTKEEKL